MTTKQYCNVQVDVSQLEAIARELNSQGMSMVASRNSSLVSHVMGEWLRVRGLGVKPAEPAGPGLFDLVKPQ